jgi:hypothetical protein
LIRKLQHGPHVLGVNEFRWLFSTTYENSKQQLYNI